MSDIPDPSASPAMSDIPNPSASPAHPSEDALAAAKARVRLLERRLARLEPGAGGRDPAADWFRQAFDHANEGVALISLGGRFLVVNRRFAEMFDQTPEDLIGRSIIEVTHPEDRYKSRDFLHKALSGVASAGRFEKRYLTASGGHFVGLVSSSLIRDQEGRPLYFISHLSDLTRRKEAETALRQSEALFRRMFDLSPVGAAMVAPDFRFLRVNAALCRLTGYEEAELLGLGFADITHPDDLADVLAQAERLRDGVIDSHEMDQRYLRKDGTEAWIRLCLRLIRDDRGRPPHYLPIMLDIGERKRLEDDLREKNRTVAERSRELEDANAALRVLLARREHDRTVLSDQMVENLRLLVLPYLDRLGRAGTGPIEAAQYVEAIKRNIDDITSPFVRSLNAAYRRLTAAEIRVADLIRAGAGNKDMAALLSLSVRTVEYHRANIRRKLGLSGHGANLAAALASLTAPPGEIP